MLQQGLLNENNALSQASALSAEVRLISQDTTPSLYLKTIYKWPILVVVYYTNPPCLFLVLYPVKVINEDKAPAYN